MASVALVSANPGWFEPGPGQTIAPVGSAAIVLLPLLSIAITKAFGQTRWLAAIDRWLKELQDPFAGRLRSLEAQLARQRKEFLLAVAERSENGDGPIPAQDLESRAMRLPAKHRRKADALRKKIDDFCDRLAIAEKDWASFVDREAPAPKEPLNIDRGAGLRL